jgi:hypothetical protein
VPDDESAMEYTQYGAHVGTAGPNFPRYCHNEHFIGFDGGLRAKSDKDKPWAVSRER